MFLSHSTKKYSTGNTSVYQKISGIEKFYGLKGGWVSRFSIENFLSHSAEKFVGETFSASKISGIEKFYA